MPLYGCGNQGIIRIKELGRAEKIRGNAAYADSIGFLWGTGL
jgi:hypothetical protein